MAHPCMLPAMPFGGWVLPGPLAAPGGPAAPPMWGPAVGTGCNGETRAYRVQWTADPTAEPGAACSEAEARLIASLQRLGIAPGGGIAIVGVTASGATVLAAQQAAMLISGPGALGIGVTVQRLPDLQGGQAAQKAPPPLPPPAAAATCAAPDADVQQRPAGQGEQQKQQAAGGKAQKQAGSLPPPPPPPPRPATAPLPPQRGGKAANGKAANGLQQEQEAAEKLQRQMQRRAEEQQRRRAAEEQRKAAAAETVRRLMQVEKAAKRKAARQRKQEAEAAAKADAAAAGAASTWLEDFFGNAPNASADAAEMPPPAAQPVAAPPQPDQGSERPTAAAAGGEEVGIRDGVETHLDGRVPAAPQMSGEAPDGQAAGCAAEVQQPAGRQEAAGAESLADPAPTPLPPPDAAAATEGTRVGAIPFPTLSDSSVGSPSGSLPAGEPMETSPLRAVTAWRSPLGSIAGSALGTPRTPAAQQQLTEAELAAAFLRQVPGSHIHLAYRRLGLPLPPMPDPNSFTEEQWAAQGHEVRSCLDYRWVSERLFVRVAWEDSWEPAGELAGLVELERLQADLRAAGDGIELCAIAQQAAATMVGEEETPAPREQRQRGGARRAARSPTPAA